MFDPAIAGRSEEGPVPSLTASEQLWLSCTHAIELASRALANVAAEGMRADVLASATLQIEATRRVLDAAEAHALVELDDLHATDAGSGHRTSRWLAHRAKLRPGAARRRLSVARTLRDELPLVDEALTGGRITMDHASVLAEAVNERNRDAMLPLLADLLDAAGSTVFHRWRRDVTSIAELLDPDGSHDPAGDLLRDTLSLSESDRFTMLRGELTGEHAAVVVQTLNTVADELFLKWSRDCNECSELEMPTRLNLLVQALVEVCRRAMTVDEAGTTPPRAEVTFVMHADHPDRVVDITGSVLPARTVPCFLCDPVCCAAMVDSLGLPVDMGRSTRSPTDAQRRALGVRDGGCTFPGCGSPIAWADAHHVEPWGRNGPTNVDNMALLCRRHHRVVHRRGWSMVVLAHGWTRFTTAAGRTFWGQQHQRQRGEQPRAGP